MTFPLLQLIFNSLIIGSIYALVAVGFSLIYSTNRFMHFAHGSAVVVAGYLTFTFFTQLGFWFWLSCIFTLAITGLLGYLMHKLIYVPLKNRKSSSVILLIASIGLLILIENLILLFHGADVKTIGLIPVAKGIEIFGAIITPLQLVILGITVAILIGLYFFLNKTKFGRNLRAVATNQELAGVMGLNARRFMAFSFIIGSVLAGIAGILIGLEQNLDPTMGTNLMVKGFSGAVVGGMYSVPGSIIGSFIVGTAENFGTWWLPSGYRDAITFTLLFLFLLFKPSGLLGVEKGVKDNA